MTDTFTFRLIIDLKVVTFPVQKDLIITRLGLFQQQVSLLEAGEYTVKSAVSANIFQQFVNFIEGSPIEVTPVNFPFLQSLSEEFLFQEVQNECDSFLKSDDNLKSEVFRLSKEVSKLRQLFESEHLYRRGCEYLYGTNGYDSTSQPFGLTLLKSAAEAGHSDAQFQCGKCHLNGKGCLQNKSLAVRYLEKVLERSELDILSGRFQDLNAEVHRCEKSDNPSAQNLLGDCFSNGRGVETDLVRGAEY
jgi:TPR repeat protein